MTEPIVITYNGIPITYCEKANEWAFTLRGRDRVAESLAQARKTIDRPSRTEKEFEPFDAVCVAYGMMEKIVVLGMAVARPNMTPELWVRPEGVCGSAARRRVRDVIRWTNEVAARFAEWQQLSAEVRRARDRQKEIITHLRPVNVADL